MREVQREGRSSIGLVLAILSVVGLSLLACNAREEGCLDIEAVNFDVTVDRNNQEECVYPNLVLNVVYRWGDTTFSQSTIYRNSFDQLLKFEEVYLMFGQYALDGVESGRLTVTNMTDWYVGTTQAGETRKALNDLVLVDRSAFVFNIGEWRVSDLMTTAQFFVGVPDTLLPTVVDSLPSEARINDSRIYYNTAVDRFANARFVLSTDTSVADLDTFHLTEEAIAFEHTMNRQFTPGSTDTVRVLIDFLRIFDNVDLTQDSASIVAGLSDNLESAIFNDN